MPSRRSQTTGHEADFTEETLLNSSVDSGKMSTLVRETLGKAVLDSACTRTICGELWLQVFLEMLNIPKL